ncbi:unnamed protein product [Lymnaea stagnalis]|uniref:Chitin-binding type-2 domain-containing protein n=1 Tax=Lymnaea stagnalis TaxID=6523 RepID=A0AAV2IFW0_LYMST
MTGRVSLMCLLVGLSILSKLEAQTHECLIQDGREANGDDSSCESYWECEDGEGTLQRCEGDSQFDFARRECLHNRAVWCQWQYDTVQQRGGLAGTPFDPRRPVNVRKPWLQGQGSGTYTGARAVTSFTHTHDGGTHVHLLDANGRYVDTTDHFHEYTRPPGQRRPQKREAGHQLGVEAADTRRNNHQAAKQLTSIHKASSAEHAYNSRGRQLGIDYDVMALKPGHGERDDVRKHEDHVEKGAKENEATGDYDADAEYDDADGGRFICGVAHGREPNMQDSECTSFWECSKYKGTQMECDEGYLYDVYAKDCRPHHEVDCRGQLQKFKDEEPEHRAEVEVKDDGVTVVHHFYHGGKQMSADLKPPPVHHDVNYVNFEQERDMKLSPQRASAARMSRRSAGISGDSGSILSDISLNPFRAWVARLQSPPKFIGNRSTIERSHVESGNKMDAVGSTVYSVDGNQTVADNQAIPVISLLQNPRTTEEIQPPMQKFRSTMPFSSPEKPDALGDVAARGAQHDISIKQLEDSSSPRGSSDVESRRWSYQAPGLNGKAAAASSSLLDDGESPFVPSPQV